MSEPYMAGGRPRSVGGRPNLGHTETVMLKLHPDLKEFVERRASENYCSQAEFIRKLIVADKCKESE